MDQVKDPEEEYLKALREAFDSKTPAEHLAGSKYLGLGRAIGRLDFTKVMEAYRKTRAKQLGTLVVVQLYVDLDDKAIVTRPAATLDEVKAAARLAVRLTKKGSVQRVVVHKHYKADDYIKEITFPTVML